SSALLILLFGLTIGNLVRGLPLYAGGFFFGTFSYLLNPYAIAVGIFAVVALVQHGATFLCMAANGEIARRSRGAITRIWWATLALYIITTAWTLAIRPVMTARPWLVLVALLSLAAFLALRVSASRASRVMPFVCSTIFLASLLLAAAATLYPYLLPVVGNGPGGLTIYAASASPHAMRWGIGATLIGLILVGTYSTLAIKRLSAPA
ncbi:MAG: cytochrome d ubiquinol oxidase subunit II, partial [Vulcanimicrobiaceae bacterium]